MSWISRQNPLRWPRNIWSGSGEACAESCKDCFVEAGGEMEQETLSAVDIIVPQALIGVDV